MTKRVSAGDAVADLDKLVDYVRTTGEPIVIEKFGEPFLVMTGCANLPDIESVRSRDAAMQEFIRLAKEAEDEREGREETDEEIVASVKKIREELYREWYGHQQ